MTTVLRPAESLTRTHGRGLLLSVLEREVLLSQIKVLRDGRFTAKTQDWNTYWTPLWELGCKEVTDCLEALHSAWRNYIRSSFDPVLRREFCFRYFSLQDAVLANCEEAPSAHAWIHALQTALGFECFGITSGAFDPEVLASGTCTLRNPCYPLAKLKMPDALDDPQFLPVTTVAGTARPELFYHYRQYTLAPHSPISLLLYPSAAEWKRPASFRLINSLISILTKAIDPWTRERARRLCQGIIGPVIRTRRPRESKTLVLEFVDVGAGSGSLVSNLCRQIQKLCASIGLESGFRVWFMDLAPSDPTRFVRARQMRAFVDSLMFVGADYRGWLSASQPLPATQDLRIALICKLLNGMSRFSIRRLSPQELALALGDTVAAVGMDVYLPSRCLAPSGGGTNALSISNSRVASHDGKTYAQLSLSGFYRGLYSLVSPERLVDSPGEGIFLPVRTFNPDCLVTADGRSIIACLIDNCDYVVIEDADLAPEDLAHHVAKFSLHSVVIRDMTKALGLKGNHAYVLWRKPSSEMPESSGEPSW